MVGALVDAVRQAHRNLPGQYNSAKIALETWNFRIFRLGKIVMAREQFEQANEDLHSSNVIKFHMGMIYLH